MEPVCVIIIDSAAEKALRSMRGKVGERTKVRVKNSSPPHDVIMVDAWWSAGKEGRVFSYMDGLTEHTVQFDPEYADMLLAQSKFKGNMSPPSFTDTQLEAIAAALGDTSSRLTGSEIGFLLSVSRISDVDPTASKRVRLYNAFANNQNGQQNRTYVLAFIRKSMKPERYLSGSDHFEPPRVRLDQALSFAGSANDQSGTLQEVTQVRTISEARIRAEELRADLVKRGVHADVLKFCSEELLVCNYFHAFLETVKSVVDKLLPKSGLSEDGDALINRALSGDRPLVRINSMLTESERSEQKGHANLFRGGAGIRNTTALEARIHWNTSKDDAEDLLSMASLIYRRLDGALT